MTNIQDGHSGGNSSTPPGREQRNIDLNDHPAHLFVIVDGERRGISPQDLELDGFTGTLQESFLDAHQPILFVLSELPRWDHLARWTVLRFITALSCPCSFRIVENGQDFQNLLDALLAMMDQGLDPEHFERVRRAAVEATAFVYPGAPTIACNRIADRLQELNIRGRHFDNLLRECRAAIRAIQGQDGNDQETSYLIDVLADAPVPENTVVPPGWRVSEAGVAMITSNTDDALLACPLVICGRRVDREDGTEWGELAWFRDGSWKRRIVPRALIATARTLVDLADFGLPVNGHNAKEVVRYLADFENANIEIMPREQVTRKMGHQGNHGEDGFLWGRQLITADGTGTELGGALSRITFRGGDDGEEQLVDGFHASGCLEGWMEGMRILQQFPRVRLAVYASLSTVLLAVLDTFNYVLSYSGTTSQGKTTALRIAASCWGRPNEGLPRAAIGTWDSSRVWIERASTVQCDHPLVLDDTKRARRVEDISQTIYDVTSGRGRGRGSVNGIRGTGTFHTVLIASGEAPITSFTRDGGTRARVLELWGSPFGEATTGTGTIVTDLNQVVMENYGHVGPQFAQYIVNSRTQWPTWQVAYRSLRQEYAEMAAGNSVAVRMAAHFAILDLTQALAAAAVCVPWSSSDLITDLWPTLIAETAEADQATAALRHVWSWAVSNSGAFWSQRPSAPPGAPNGGWAGRWEKGGDWDFVGFIRGKIVQILRDGEFEPEPILRTWRNREWLRMSPGRLWYRTRVDRSPDDLVAIQREVIDELVGADGESSSG